MITNEHIHASRQIAGRVARWHTWPMIRRPTVAEHQCRVAQLYVEVWGLPRAEVLVFCLQHDMGEQTAGDVPYGAKRLSPALAQGCNEAEREGLFRLGIVLPELTPDEFTRFKVCDLLEMYETACVEARMGNGYALAPMRSCLEAVRDMTHLTSLAPQVTSWLAANNCTDIYERYER